jgi:hypothetical protein
MTENLAYCGLFCHTCPIFLATREENLEKQEGMRTQIANLCNDLYGLIYTANDISDCDGCRTEGGRLFTGCQSCEIRKCARMKELENCAQCSDYICGKLETFFAKEPEARKRLDEVRSSS